MKKILCVLAAAVLALASCDKESGISEADIVGTWEVVKAVCDYHDGEIEDVTEDFCSVWIFSKGGEFAWYDSSDPDDQQPGYWELKGSSLTLTLLYYMDRPLEDGGRVACNTGNTVTKSGDVIGGYEPLEPFIVKKLTSDKMTLEWCYYGEDGDELYTIDLKKL